MLRERKRIESHTERNECFRDAVAGLPKITLLGVTGELAEQGYARAREGYEKIKAASEEMNGSAAGDLFEQCQKRNRLRTQGVRNLKRQCRLCARLLRPLFDSKSATDVYTLSAAQVRKGFDTASTKQGIVALAQKLRRKRVSRSRSASPSSPPSRLEERRSITSKDRLRVIRRLE